MIKTKVLVLSCAFCMFSLAAQNSELPPPDMSKQFDAVIKIDSGEKTIKNQKIESGEDSKNAIFVQNDGKATVQGVTIHTTKNGSRGLYAAFGGTINAKKVDVTTEGEHCAAFATDMGEGTVTVDGSKALTKGKGSPVIYSTGDIQVKNLTGTAENSEMAVIEGKNSVLIEKSKLTGGSGLDGEVSCGIMLYQSMSGDANVGTATFTSKNSSLTNKAKGPFFYITNTNAIINLEGTKLEGNSDIFIQASGNNSKRGWGRRGANGGQVKVNLTSQTAKGDIVVDKISSLSLNLGKKAFFTGAVNVKNQGKVDLSLDKTAKIEITADSYFNKFEDADSSFKNIKSNGHKIYYNKNLSENKALSGRTVILSDGGKLLPADYDFSELENALSSQNQKRGMGEKMPPMPNGDKPMQSGENAPDGKMPPKMDMTKISGTLNLVSEKAMLIDDNNKATLLTVMEMKGGKDNKDGKNPQPMKASMENPPENKDRAMGQPPVTGTQKRPKPVTFEDLKKLKGKKVEIEGILEKDGSFRVMKISEK